MYKRGLRGPRLCDDGMNYYASGSMSCGSLFRMPYYAVWYALLVCRMDMAYGIPFDRNFGYDCTEEWTSRPRRLYDSGPHITPGYLPPATRL